MFFYNYNNIGQLQPFANCTDGDLRLVNGSTPQEGRVEVCINHAWGTICGKNSFDTNEARVICHQLVGYYREGTV